MTSHFGENCMQTVLIAYFVTCVSGENKMAAEKINLLLSLFFAWLAETFVCSNHVVPYGLVSLHVSF